MLDTYRDQTVCFGISRKRGRIPLGISQLVNIKQEIITELEGMQLFKVNARNFAPFFYQYEVKSADRKNYTGVLMKSMCSEHAALVKESDVAVQSMADDVVKTVLHLLEKAGKGPVINMCLTFAMEISPGTQLWLLGATKIMLQRPEIYKLGRRGVHRLKSARSSSCGTFMLIPRDMEKIGTCATERKRVEVCGRVSLTRAVSRKENRTKLFTRQEPRRLLIGQVPTRNQNKIQFFTAHKTTSHPRPFLTEEKPMRKPIQRCKLLLETKSFDSRKNFTTVKSKPQLRLEKPVEITPFQAKIHNTHHVKVKSHTNLRLCCGDFCRFHGVSKVSVKTEPGSLYPLDPLLINIGRMRMFSPYENPTITQTISTFIQTDNSTTPLVNDLVYPIDPDDETYKFVPGEDKIHFLIKVKKNLADEQIDEILSKIREKVKGDPGSLNSIPANVLRLIRKHGEDVRVDVCGTCKTIYVNILRYLSKLILGVNE